MNAEIKEQIKKKLKTDPVFAAALKAAGNREEAWKVLLATGFQVGLEDVLALAKADAAPLSEDDLGKVAGGELFWKWL